MCGLDTHIEFKIHERKLTRTHDHSPLVVLPKKPKKWEVINLASSVIFNASIWYFMGFKSLFYLLMSTILGAYAWAWLANVMSMCVRTCEASQS